jgi:hypothetical protein
MPDRHDHHRRPGRKRRNPYLILGVDFAAEPAEATKAFARISRRLRRNRTSDGGGFMLEDATWALHEIEQAATDPEAALGIFRVPANPEVYDVASGPGIVGLEPENLTRTTPAGSSDAVVSLQAQVIDHLGRAALETTLNTLLAPYT